MNLSLKFRDRLYSLSTWLVQELDQAFTAIRSVWDVEHNDDGTHAAITATQITLNQPSAQDSASGLGKGVVLANGADDSKFRGDVMAGVGVANGVLVPDMASQNATDATTSIGTFDTGEFRNLNSSLKLLPSENSRTGVLFGPAASGMLWLRKSSKAHFTASTWAMGLFDLSLDATNPVLLMAKDGADLTMTDGGAGAVRVNIGNTNRHMQNGYFDHLFLGTTGEVGLWQSWTPSWTNLTVGNGSVTANYARVGGITFIEVIVVFGTTTSITGAVTIGSLPVNQTAASIQIWGRNVYYDSSIGFTYYGGNQPTGASTFIPLIDTVSGTQLVGANVTGTAPFTWATSDQLYVLGFYR